MPPADEASPSPAPGGASGHRPSDRQSERWSDSPRALELVEAARALAARGFALATSGNFSVRLDAGRAIITRSGRDKSRLTADDLMLVDLAARALEPAGAVPSAEAALHGQLYRRFPAATAILHVHAPAATALSLRHGAVGAIHLRGYEMVKALEGVTTHEHDEVVPIVPNSQDMAVLGAAVEGALGEHPAAHAYLIAGHGLYTWASSVSAARRHVEALEFLFDVELRLRG